MRRHTRRLIGLLLLLLSLDLSAPAAFRPGAKSATHAAQVSQQDITITVEPYLDADLVRRTFDKLLVQHGITPVKVTIRNERVEPVRVIDGSIRLITTLDIQHRPLTAQEILQEVSQRAQRKRRGYPTRGPLPIPPGSRLPPITGRDSSVSGKLKDLDTAIRSKELGERLVPPHSEESGFLFFRVNGDSKLWGSGRLYIPEIRTLKTNDRLLFFEIDLQPAK